MYRAINQEMTPRFGRWARKNYGIGGKKLIAKVFAGEGGGTTKNPNVSSAGARGPAQFIPSTRAAYIKQYGVDPWASDRAAVKGAMIHLRGTGIAGYNPGMPSYQSYILGQKVDTSPLRTGKYGLSGAPPSKGKPKERGAKITTKGGGTKTDETSAIVDALLAGSTGRSRVPLLTDVNERLASGAYTTTEPMTTTRERGKPKDEEPAVPKGSGNGKLVGAPLDRSGVKTKQHILGTVRNAADWGGLSIQLGTGTSHNRMTTSGNVSDHWDGNAIDLPATGSKGDRIATAILVQLGVGPRKAKGMARKGGVFSGTHKGKRWQVLWKTTEGGNHYDHVHFGWR